MTQLESMSTLFANVGQTAMYREYRPQYPHALYEAIYAKVFPGHPSPPFGAESLAVDVATGSGQALGPIPQHFGRVIAVDGSAAQLGNAPCGVHPNVEFRLADAHATGLPDRCADLVVVGQALHWFRLPEFYTEARRILKPSGGLAAFSYDFGRFDSHPDLSAAYMAFANGLLGPYWAPGRKIVDAHYEGIEPGPEYFGRAERVHLAMDAEISLRQLVGLMRSWSGYQGYMDEHPGAADPLLDFEADCVRRLGLALDTKLTLNRNLTVLIATQPRR